MAKSPFLLAGKPDSVVPIVLLEGGAANVGKSCKKRRLGGDAGVLADVLLSAPGLRSGRDAMLLIARSQSFQIGSGAKERQARLPSRRAVATFTEGGT
jgi:hypothetical protein